MLSDEEKEIFKNLKEYMQNSINNGYHKFVYNDLDWDFKCIDCINAIDKVIEELKNADLTTVYLNGVYDGEKKVEDKIKAKIEEIDYKMIAHQDVREAVKQVLQSLLEKE